MDYGFGSEFQETPVFQWVVADGRIARTPVAEVLKRQPKEIILMALAQPAHVVPFFVYTAFFLVYGTKVLGLSRDFLLFAMLVGSAISFFTIPFSGYLSDQFGRKQVYIFGAIGTGLFAFAYYALLDTALPGLIVLATLIAYFFHNLTWGPVAALIAECFAPRLRYSGMSIGFQVATVFASGPAPMISTALLALARSSQVIAFYVFGCTIVSIAAVLALPDSRHRDFARDQTEDIGA